MGLEPTAYRLTAECSTIEPVSYTHLEQKEIARLRRELRDAQDALDVLKKAINILGK